MLWAQHGCYLFRFCGENFCHSDTCNPLHLRASASSSRMCQKKSKPGHSMTGTGRHWPPLAATGLCVDRALDMDCAAQKESSGMNATTSAVAGSSNTVQNDLRPTMGR